METHINNKWQTHAPLPRGSRSSRAPSWTPWARPPAPIYWQREDEPQSCNVAGADVCWKSSRGWVSGGSPFFSGGGVHLFGAKNLARGWAREWQICTETPLIFLIVLILMQSTPLKLRALSEAGLESGRSGQRLPVSFGTPFEAKELGQRPGRGAADLEREGTQNNILIVLNKTQTNMTARKYSNKHTTTKETQLSGHLAEPHREVCWRTAGLPYGQFRT